VLFCQRGLSVDGWVIEKGKNNYDLPAQRDASSKGLPFPGAIDGM
jgi:hypothetical protein